MSTDEPISEAFTTGGTPAPRPLVARLWHAAPGFGIVLALVSIVVITGLMHWPWRAHLAIDPDESTFIVVGASLWSGYLPYEHLFDNKPPLTFFISAIPAAFGPDIAYVRLFHFLCASAVGCLIFGIARPYAGRLIAWGAALLFAIHQREWGAVHLSSEVMALLFLLPAVWLGMRHRFERHVFWVGVLLSCACLVRMNLAIAVALITLYLYVVKFRWDARYARFVLTYAVAGLTPLALLIVLYAARGSLEALMAGLIYVPLTYASSEGGVIGNLAVWSEFYRYRLTTSPEFLLTTTGLWLIGLVSLMIKRWREGWTRGGHPLDFLLVCLMAVSLSVLMSGEAYRHYAVQVIPFVALIAAVAGTMKWTRHPAAQVLVLVVVLGLCVQSIQRNFTLANYTPNTNILRDYLQDRLGPGDTIWFHRGHILYWLLDRPVVTAPLIHPSNLYRRSIRDTLVRHGQLHPDHIQDVLAKQPRYIVWPSNPTQAEAQTRTLFKNDYISVKNTGAWQLFERKSGDAQDP